MSRKWQNLLHKLDAQWVASQKREARMLRRLKEVAKR